MSVVPSTELAGSVGVNWYLRVKRKKLRNGEEREYLYLVKVTCRNGKCREEWIGNVEEIERIIREYKRKNPRPYRKRGNRGGAPMVRPPGFEPGIAGLEGRRPSPG